MQCLLTKITRICADVAEQRCDLLMLHRILAALHAAAAAATATRRAARGSEGSRRLALVPQGHRRFRRLCRHGRYVALLAHHELGFRRFCRRLSLTGRPQAGYPFADEDPRQACVKN